MGRRKSVKTAHWSDSKDLHIIRMSEEGVIQMVKNKRLGVYYCILDGKYQVTDNRGSKIEVNTFNTAEEVIEYYNKKEGFENE